jgi:ankyrin repeat protein
VALQLFPSVNGIIPKAAEQGDATAQCNLGVCYYKGEGVPEDVITLLVKNGADINARDTNGDTPLLLAAFYQKLSNTKLLIKAGADVNLQDKKGDTALTTILGCFEFRMRFEPHDTTKQKEARDFAILDYLLSAGANPNIKDMKGNTALHLVPIEVPGPEQVSAAKDLVKHGADVTAKNNESKTAIDLSQGALRAYLEGAAKSLR